MPVWIKTIIFIQVFTLVYSYFVRLCYSDKKSALLEMQVTGNYSPWIAISGFLIIFSILSVVPEAFWFIFFRG